MIIFLERMWLMIAIVCVVLAAYKSIVVGYKDGLYFLIFAGAATILFLLRRRTRKQMERENQNDEKE